MAVEHAPHATSQEGQPASGTPDPTSDPTLLKNALEWRSIGPFRGGRVVAVAGDPVHPQVFYFGSTGGGIWKTTDGGLYWENISDGFFKRASVGAIAVAPSDPNVIYVGMGETTIRGNVSHGDGVYKSTDAGKTWTHLGLEATRNIAKVRIHPQDPEVVYVAALGHAHGPNAERGIYRSRNGGKTWQRILFRGEQAGVIDLAMDPNNPRILFAAFWEARRGPHELVSGGEGSGLFKSTDGGDTWSEITRNKGLPQGLLGKIGVVVSPARPERVWAIVEAEDGAVFRSDDGGMVWERLCAERDLRERPWYYQHIHADPQDPETVWVLNVQAWKSIDGGRTFFKVAIPHGDNHDLWIDPRDPRRMIEGNDGGACVTFNGGETWSSLYNQPTAEFYHVTTDQQVPYHVYGAQQDNSTISVPSRSNLAAITIAEYQEIGGGESGYIAVRPDDPSVVYAGNYLGYLTRCDLRTGQRRDISVWPEPVTGWPARDARYRFQWTFPTVLSPHDPSVLYVTGNHVFRSTDEGDSWEVISPDLTRNDVGRMGPSGGPITKDNVGTEYYGTIFAFAESPLVRGLLWAGSDDGLVHLSRDGGQTWQDVTPPELPEWALISIIEPSPHDPAAAYLAATRYKLDDFQPYLYKTSDYGQTWTRITAGIRPDDFTRVIRVDPARHGLLYAGSETGVYISFDDGGCWQSLQLNLPAVPIHDLEVKGSDLIAATHGRSFWILDDLTPLHQLDGQVDESTIQLCKPRPAIRFWSDRAYYSKPLPGKNYGSTGALIAVFRQRETPTGEKVEVYLDAGQNPRDGVYVSYLLGQRPEGEVTLTFLDAEGHEIKTFSSEKKEQTAEGQETQPLAEAEREPHPERKPKEKEEPRVPKETGLNRFFWDMRYPDPVKVETYVASEDVLSGPLAVPGAYQVRLTVGDQTRTEWFEIWKDPRVPAGEEDLRSQLELLLRIRDKLSETHETVNMLQSLRQQIQDWERRAEGHPSHDAVAAAGKPLREQLTAIEEELIQVKAKNRQDTLDFPIKLNAKLAGLAGVVASADARPTRQAYEVFADLSCRVDEQLRRLRRLIDTDVAAFNARLREEEVPAVMPRMAATAVAARRRATRRSRRQDSWATRD